VSEYLCSFLSEDKALYRFWRERKSWGGRGEGQRERERMNETSAIYVRLCAEELNLNLTGGQGCAGVGGQGRRRAKLQGGAPDPPAGRPLSTSPEDPAVETPSAQTSPVGGGRSTIWHERWISNFDGIFWEWFASVKWNSCPKVKLAENEVAVFTFYLLRIKDSF